MLPRDAVTEGMDTERWWIAGLEPEWGGGGGESGRAEKGEKKGEAENQADCAASLPKSLGCCILDAGDLGPLCPAPGPEAKSSSDYMLCFYPSTRFCVCLCVCVCWGVGRGRWHKALCICSCSCSLMWSVTRKSPRMAGTPDILGFVPPLDVWDSQIQALHLRSSCKINLSDLLLSLGPLQSTNMFKHLPLFNTHNYSVN